jgi:hypothetical protein
MLSQHSLSVVRHARKRVAQVAGDKTKRQLDKRKRQVAQAGRQLISRRLAGSDSAWLEYGAILDGHTLNLCLRPPAGIAADNLDARVVLGSAGAPVELPATIRASAKSWRVECTALLGAQLGGIDVPPGRFTLDLHLSSPDRHEARVLAVRGERSGGSPSGPTLAQQTCPITGVRHRFGLTVTGRARLDVLPAAALAELVDLRLSLTSALLTVNLIGSDSGISAIEAVAEHGSLPCPVWEPPVQEQPAAPESNAGRADGSRLTVRVPLAAMAARQGGKQAEAARWSFEAVLTDGRRLRVARQLHGLRSPLRVFTTQSVPIAIGHRTVLRVTTGFTRRGTLELFLRPALAGRPAVPNVSAQREQTAT